MGYRFTLQTANIIANLTFGKVFSCYRYIFESNENLNNFIDFLDRFEENMISGRIQEYNTIVSNLKKILVKCRKEHFHKYIVIDKIVYEEEILVLLKLLSNILSRCKIKALLLPSVEKNYMTDFYFLKKIVDIHPADSCLILQPDDVYNSMQIFNAFPNFENALNNIDEWPAIFFWDNKGNYVFVPIYSEEEVIFLFKIIKYERDPIPELRLFARRKKKFEHYIFHLSDLHIGDHKVINGESRLKTLIKKRIENTINDGDIDVIITGDAVESPQKKYEIMYESFSKYVELCNGKRPIRLLGNHDIKNHGICLCQKSKKTSTKSKDFPKIMIIEKFNTILLFFNSNMGGNLAQGEIGKAQMTKMGNKLDSIKNLEKYTLIAFLHHHIMPIPEPNFFTKKLFGKIIDESLKLIDSKIFVEWLKQRNVKLVLHGHKHIPFYIEEDGVNIMACGSSTGKVDLKDKNKTYISYNVIKINSNGIVCVQYVEDILGAGEQHLNIKYIKK